METAKLGKTTFLSALSLRLDPYRMSISGDVRLNGEAYTKHQLKSMSGYVMQDDVVHAHLTISETLGYTAELRLPVTTSAEDRKARYE